MTRLACYRLRTRLVELAESTLGPADRRAVEQHVAGCAACAATLAALRDAPGRLRAALPAERDEAFWLRQRNDVMRAVRARAADATPVPAATHHAVPWGTLLAGVAAVLLAVVVTRAPRREEAVVGAPVAVGAVGQIDALDDEDLVTLADVTRSLASEGAPIVVTPESDADAREAAALDDDDLDALGDLIGAGAT